MKYDIEAWCHECDRMVYLIRDIRADESQIILYCPHRLDKQIPLEIRRKTPRTDRESNPRLTPEQ